MYIVYNFFKLYMNYKRGGKEQGLCVFIRLKTVPAQDKILT